MKRDDLSDLIAFAVVAEQGSFTRAAALLGTSQPALSRAITALEARLGARLLARTTRSVSTTAAGQALLDALQPALADIGAAVSVVGAMGARPSGTVRITATKHAVSSVLMPALPKMRDAHPEVKLEVVIDDALTDIVAQRFDAGIRFGDWVDKDMIGVRVGPDLRMAVVASPAHFAAHPAPRTPRELASHACLGYRNMRTGGLLPWEFVEKGRPIEVRVDGPLVFNDGDLLREAALAGQGVAYAYEDTVAADVASGSLVRALERYCPPFAGYSLYYPSRRQVPPALAVFVAALRPTTASKPARRNGARPR